MKQTIEWRSYPKEKPTKSGKYLVQLEDESIFRMEYDECYEDGKFVYREYDIDTETLAVLDEIVVVEDEVIAWSFIQPYVEGDTETKNVNEDFAEVDEFRCEKCGIHLEDWHSVEVDLDDGEKSYHEYTFRYCPNCGRKIVYN